MIFSIRIYAVRETYFSKKADALRCAREAARDFGTTETVERRTLNVSLGPRDLAIALLNGENWYRRTAIIATYEPESST